MCIRTTRRTVTFTSPFSLNGVDRIQCPGTYLIAVDGERIEGLSFPAYRRIATAVELSSRPERPGVTEVVATNPAVLEAALERGILSRSRSTGEPSAGRSLGAEDLQAVKGAPRNG